MVSPFALLLVALSVDLCFSCLGTKFMLTYPVKKDYMYTEVVTMYTYHQEVKIKRADKISIPGFYGNEPEITDITLTRFKKVHFQLQFNDSMYQEYNNLDHIVILEGDEAFGVNVMLLGQEYSVATMTVLPLRYYGTEYYPFFLSENQTYMVLMQRNIPHVSPAQLQITFNSGDKHVRTKNQLIDSLQMYPYICDNKEVSSPYQSAYGSTAVGQPAVTTGATMCIIVGNCYVADKRSDHSTNCSLLVRDDLIDMPPATQFAAKEFIAFKGVHNNPKRSYIVVMGIVASTSVNVFFHGTFRAAFTVEKGHIKKIYLNDPYQFINASRAIQVYLLFTSSCTEDEVGGPSMTSLIPNALFHNRYIWSLPYHLKVTERNYLVVIIRANQNYGFVFNQVINGTNQWSWKPVSGTEKWLVSENEIVDFPDVFSLASGTNRAFGLYLYGVDLTISYLHYVDFMPAVTYEQRQFCSESKMAVGDRIDNDCDGFPDEESSLNSDDDEDGMKGEDVRAPVSKSFLDKDLQVDKLKTERAMAGPEESENTSPGPNYILWFGLFGILPIPVIVFMYQLSKRNNEDGDKRDVEPAESPGKEIAPMISEPEIDICIAAEEVQWAPEPAPKKSLSDVEIESLG